MLFFHFRLLSSDRKTYSDCQKHNCFARLGEGDPPGS